MAESDRDANSPDAKAPDAKAALATGLSGALSGAAERRRLEEAFAPWRAVVNRHLALRAALDGFTVGAIAGAAFAGVAWATHHPALRAGGLAIAGASALVAGVRGARRAWSDERVALYVDGVLGTPESITSAIVLGRDAPPEVLDQAIVALESGARRAPSRVRRVHGLALAGTIACVAFLAVRVPTRAQAAPPTGTDVVKLSEVPGLDKIAEVEKLPAKDAAQKERLEKIAEEARALKKKLIEGMPRREALDRLNKLRQKLEAEKLGANQNKAGLDAASQSLKSSGFPGLADALDDRDLQSFDEMMERIANEREDVDRQKAKEALEKAIDEAKKKGADDVAKALEKQKQKLDARKDKGDVLRELADALKGTPGDASKQGKNYDDKATDDAAKELGDALRKGLEKLSPEERKRLAEKLEKKLADGGGKMSPKAKKKLKELADKLKTPEGQKELQKELEDLAKKGDGDSDDEKREEGLDEADDGADDAGKELGDQKGKDGKDSKGKKGKKGKKPGKDGDKGDGKDGDKSDGKDGKDGDGKDGDGKDGDGDGNGGGMPIPMDGSGASPGGGGDGADHKGKSKKLDAESYKAKAKGLGAKGTPKPVGGKIHTPGQDGASATVKSSGDVNGTIADEVNGVDKADIPEAVRRQVKAYFE